MITVVYSVAVLGVLGAVFGLLLAIAAKKFAVSVDERQEKIVESLPGANCGGCGFAGCSAYASAVIAGEAPIGKCAAGGQEAAEKMAAIMGVEAGTVEKTVAFVRCTGGGEAQKKFEYYGISDCLAATKIGGNGPAACAYGCLGFGTCAAACPFGAMSVVNGVAHVDEEKCTGCMTCAEACPRGLITSKPYDAKVAVGCASKDKGAAVRAICGKGCIGCMLCVKACEHDAIHVADNLASIDWTKCVGCGACVEKCPRKIISLSK